MRYQTIRGLTKKPDAGTCVRFTPSFLEETRQGLVTDWTTVECSCELCAGGRHVAVNEPAIADGVSALRPRWRHISFRNLERVVVPDEPPPTRPA